MQRGREIKVGHREKRIQKKQTEGAKEKVERRFERE